MIRSYDELKTKLKRFGKNTSRKKYVKKKHKTFPLDQFYDTFNGYWFAIDYTSCKRPYIASVYFLKDAKFYAFGHGYTALEAVRSANRNLKKKTKKIEEIYIKRVKAVNSVTQNFINRL